MITIRRYRNSVQAACAAEALRAEGIPAEVVGEHSFGMLPVHTYGFASLHVVIPSESLRARAEEILASMTDEQHPLESLPIPDLARLAPQHRDAPCPSCAARVRISPGLDRCGACAAPIDPVALVADVFGPEAMAPCYDDASPRCDACGAPAGGNDRCPSCGRPAATHPRTHP